MNDEKVTRRLLIHGRVQGVYFRGSMQERARLLGINGWVRNRNDGSVEAMVCGEPDVIAQIIEWARKGPAIANVTDVQIETAQGQFDKFEILRSS